MKTIVWPEKKRYVEAINAGFEYVLLSATGASLHAAVQCKDFFQDAFWSEATQQPCAIYGFAWAPGRLVLTAAQHRIAVRYNNKPMQDYRQPLLSFLNAWEERLGFRQSTVELANDGTVLVVTFGREWVAKPILVSAFTLFLRVGCTYDVDVDLSSWVRDFPIAKHPLVSADQSQVRSALENGNLVKLLEGRSDFAQAYTDYAVGATSTLHHHSGLVGWKSKR